MPSCDFPGTECGFLGEQAVFTCVERAVMLCKPCRADEECESPYNPQEPHRCVDYGQAGSFCGIDCGPQALQPCPYGYECIDSQCVAAGGCDCPAYHAELQAETDCHVTNDNGTCTGQRVCTGEGLSPCDAKTPTPEECNGVDDDCDGDTDETCP